MELIAAELVVAVGVVPLWIECPHDSDVLAQRHRVIGRKRLRDVVDARQDRWHLAFRIASEDRYGAGIRSVDAEHRAHEGGLARSVASQHGADRSRGDVDRNIVARLLAESIGFRETPANETTPPIPRPTLLLTI